MRTSPRGGSRKSWKVAKIVRLGDTSAPRRRNLTFVITSARECPHVALEVVDRYRGNDTHRRRRRLDVEVLGYCRIRRAGGGTGAAATFLELGLVLLIVGSTGVGVRVMMSQEPSMRVVLALASPLVALGVEYIAGGGIGYSILVVGGTLAGTRVPDYLLAESAILGLAVIGLVAGP
jgi:hypothetical protein